MFSLFKKDVENKNDNGHLSLISIAALLIHSAKIDENFTEKEKNIIKKALIEMGADQNDLDKIFDNRSMPSIFLLNEINDSIINNDEEKFLFY